MKNNSKSWADVTTQNQYKGTKNDWPDLSNQTNQHKSNIKQDDDYSNTSTPPVNFSERMHSLTNVLEQMSTNDAEQNKHETQAHKSRDDIRAERKVRRKVKKIEKDERLFQEKLAQIREPKTQKIKIVDQNAMETYLANQKINSNRNRRTKSKNSVVKVNLLDVLNVQVVRPIDRSCFQNRQTIKLTSSTQQHKGKKSQFKKKKYVSRLKRSILLSRRLRNQVKPNVDSVVVEPTSTNLEDPQDNKESLTKDQNKTTKNDDTTEITTITSTESYKSTEITTLPPNVKFSRKFRP